MVDPKWHDGEYPNDDPPRAGIGVGLQIQSVVGSSAAGYEADFASQAEVHAAFAKDAKAVGESVQARDWIYRSWAIQSHDISQTHGFNGDLAAAARSIKARVLLLPNCQDQLHPPREGGVLEVAQHIPHAKLVDFDDIGGHRGSRSAPSLAVFDTEVKDLLKRIADGRARHERASVPQEYAATRLLRAVVRQNHVFRGRGESMNRAHAFTALVAFTFCVSASAQNLKPGLWEVTNKMKSSSGTMEKSQAHMQEQLAKMPPAERKKMEEMMAQHGVKMGSGAPGAMTAQTCMTKDMVERNEIPAHHGDCKTTKQQRKGNTTTYAFSCTTPPSSGEGQYTVVSPEAYTFKMTMNTSVHGKPETMNMDGSGKWLAADCGNLKPMKPPGK